MNRAPHVLVFLLASVLASASHADLEDEPEALIGTSGTIAGHEGHTEEIANHEGTSERLDGMSAPPERLQGYGEPETSAAQRLEEAQAKLRAARARYAAGAAAASPAAASPSPVATSESTWTARLEIARRRIDVAREHAQLLDERYAEMLQADYPRGEKRQDLIDERNAAKRRYDSESAMLLRLVEEARGDGVPEDELAQYE